MSRNTSQDPLNSRQAQPARPCISLRMLRTLIGAMLTLLILPTAAHAALTISSVQRASNADGVGSASVTVYGGVAGDVARCDTTSSTETCNTCRFLDGTDTIPDAGNNLSQACNNRRIHPNLLLQISMSSDATDGRPVVTDADGQNAINLASAPSSVAKGGTATIELTWENVCSRLFAKASDSGSLCVPTADGVTGSLRIGISSDGDDRLDGSGDDYRTVNFVIRREIGQGASAGGTSVADNCSVTSAIGICYFEMGSGDSKAFVRSLEALNGFPSGNNIQFKFVRFYFDDRGFDYIGAGSSYVDLPINSTDVSSFSVSPKRIESLKNEQTYFFRAAVVDAAGNVGYYTAAADNNDCTRGVNPASTTCRTATPGEVVGVLSQSSCFIATAAHGSNMSRDVELLRDFRDQRLQSSAVGRGLVQLYYRLSPPLAQALERHQEWKPFVRAALTPITALARWILQAGWWSTLAILGAIATAVLLIGVWLRGARPSRQAIAGLVACALLIGAPSVGFSQVDESEEAALEENLSEAQATEPETEDEEVAEPEYPQPGAEEPGAIDEEPEQVADTAPTPAPAAPSANLIEPLEPPGGLQLAPMLKRPKAVGEEGEYYHDTDDVDNAALGTFAQPERVTREGQHLHGAPPPIEFSGQGGREKPMSISTQGEFYYPVEKSEFVGAAGVRFGVLSPPDLRNPDNGLTFKQIYKNSSVLPAIGFDYEYPFTRAIGRMGLRAEVGIITAQAKGRFKNPTRVDEETDERFTFLMLPLQATLLYRFQFWDTQLFVPFVEGGGMYAPIIELRDDTKAPRYGGAPAAVAAGGLNILLDGLDPTSILHLDADYGINHVWLTLQYRQIVGVKKDLDISSNLISAGLSFDF
jgi:hypothetical protein